MIRRLNSSLHHPSGAARPALMTGALASGIALPRDAIAFLTDVLGAHHAPPPLIERLVAAAAAFPPQGVVADRLAAALADELLFTPFDDVLCAPALLLLGPPGAGKTTLAAKLATCLGNGNTALINADPERAGSSAQLAECAEVLGMPLAVAVDAAALANLAAAAGGRRIIIDTKGTAPHDAAGCSALAALITASAATPLLVLPADSAADEAAAMARCFAPLGARLLLPTRLDLVRRLGGVLAAADAGRLALAATSAAPQFAYGLRPLTPLLLARLLLAVTDGAPQPVATTPA
jgi:flagellar biosynthesis protein FlhF